MPVMGRPLRRDRRQAAPRRATDRSTSAWRSTWRRATASRTLMVPVILDAGAPAVRRFLARLRRARGEGAHEHAHRRRPRGRQHHAHQPGRAGHGRLGAAADDRPGHDRRHRLDRLPGGPRQHRRDDRRREGHDDDLDLRPPHHPGRRVRALPGADRGLPAGRARLLRGACSPRWAWSSVRPQSARAGGRGRRRTRALERPGAAVAQRGAAAGRAGRDRTARSALPQPRPPRRAP